MTTAAIPRFAKWATGFSGCDGGDIGSSRSRSIWICGIEWGGGHDANVKTLNEMFEEDVSLPSPGYEDWQHNLEYPYNWQAMKLLATIDNRDVEDYRQFAEEVKPFTIGSTGYYKMNLYPLGFKNTSHAHWVSEFSEATGFHDKGEYHQWIKLNRFSAMRSWAAVHAPKLIICTGKTYISDFRAAFGDEKMDLTTETIDDRQLTFGFNCQGTLVAIIPFMLNRYGLTRNISIQKVGARIRTLLNR